MGQSKSTRACVPIEAHSHILMKTKCTQWDLRCPIISNSLDVALKSEVWLRLNRSSVSTCKNKYTLNIQWNICYHIKIKETGHNEEILQSETHSHWASPSSRAGATSSAVSVGAIHCSLVHSPSSSSSWQSSQGSRVSHIWLSGDHLPSFTKGSTLASLQGLLCHMPGLQGFL